ncbi:division/cell wall cluster transcriptional repressor MraZ [Litorimonas sp. RW-G-Af-16]|uniref:division/cell wall cluster transcriptional repressor MraZ n=1 Tax=Litorimonas sp. RW-G-Af-16 TaxID=3241168 RepID=UPI00390C8344
MFLSSATNALDAKGRVSVPADFRSVVAGSEFDGIIVWPSFDGAYLEGGGIDLLKEYQRSLETLDYYDEGRIALQRAIFAESRRLPFDSGGRVSLPKDLHEYAGLNGKVTFVGLGRRFEIWSPKAHAERTENIRKLARENRHRLRPVSVPDGSLPSGGLK